MKQKAQAVVASVVLALGGVAGLDTFRPDAHTLLQQRADGGCVVPDCRTWFGRGAWNPAHEPVDCVGVGHLAMGADGGRWRGCVVMPAAYAKGGQCLPAACELPAGLDPFAEMQR